MTATAPSARWGSAGGSKGCISAQRSSAVTSSSAGELRVASRCGLVCPRTRCPVPDPIRVLIVDDDVPTRIGVRTILTSEPGIEVVGEAASGVQAIALGHSTSPNVVLMDVQLPDLDGIEVTRHLLDAAEDSDSAPRVIVLT